MISTKERKSLNQFGCSLLWPEGHTEPAPVRSSFTLHSDAIRDIELDKVFREITGSESRYLEMENLLTELSLDPYVINYRQDVLEDLLANPAIVQSFEKLLPHFDILKQGDRSVHEGQFELYKLAVRLSELESFVICCDLLYEAFNKQTKALVSAGLGHLRKIIDEICTDPAFYELKAELPGLMSKIRGIRSVTIGVNLNKHLLPFEATLLAVNSEEFTQKSFNLLNRILGKKNEWESLVNLHVVPDLVPRNKNPYTPQSPNYSSTVNPLMVPLFKDLDRVITKITGPVSHAIKAYVSMQTGFLAALSQDIGFYLGAVRLVRRLERTGLPFTRPEILNAEERKCIIRDSYNINLVLGTSKNADSIKESIVLNDIELGPDGRIILLTGPNQGGKTTYLQSVGLCTVLAQLGLPVPGSHAEISVVDNIFTHFPVQEKIDRGTGRLGDEAKRIDEIFSVITGASLLLLNESFSSTAALESSYIAGEMIRILRMLGSRTVFTTHLHDLAQSINDINNETEQGEKIISLVAQVNDSPEVHGGEKNTPSFKIVRSAPEGKSFAREIAEKFGISYGQLAGKLKARGLIK